MKTSVKMALATGAVAAAGGLFLVGSSFAEGGFGGARFGMGGPGGHGVVLREMLANVDTNSDSALSQEEIDSAVNARFTQFDADKNGDLSLQEFEALWADITRPMAVRAFQFLDPNGDAAVAKSEIDERFGSLVARFDRNDDGMLNQNDRPRHRGWGHHGPRRWMDRGDGPETEQQ
jgi:hypothetical protein